MFKWFRNQKVIVKFIALSTVILVAAFTVLISWNLTLLNKVSMDLGMLEAQNTGQNFADNHTKIVQNTVASLASLRSTFLDEVSQGNPDRQRMVRLLGSLLNDNDSVSSIFTVWEPNAYGKDLDYTADPLYAVNGGRMATLAIRFDDGQIMPVPFGGLDTFTAYEQAKSEKQAIVMEPYNASTEDGNSELLTMIVLPVLDQDGQFLGVIGGAFLLDTFQQSAEQEHPLGGNVSLLSQGGLYIANGENAEDTGNSFLASEHNHQVFEKVQQGQLVHQSIDASGTAIIRAFKPIPIIDDELWYVQTAIPKSEILKAYTANRNESVVIGIVALLLLGAGIWLLARIIVISNIQRMVHALQGMAKGDLTQTVDIRAKDEFGQMAVHLNEASANLRHMLKQTSEIALTVSATSEQLTSSAEQTALAAQTISASMEVAAEGMQEQHSEASQAASMMQEMTESVGRVSTSAEAVSASAEDVISQTEHGNQVVQRAVGEMNMISASMEASNEAMKRLGMRSGEIESLVGLISGISNQTKILSLNASVEAARAGEQGRGFAVVAAEIRKLAEQTKDAVEQVQAGISEISADTEQAEQLIDRTALEVEKGLISVTESGRLFSSIMEEMKLVGIRAQEVSSEVHDMSTGTLRVAEAVELVSGITEKSTSQTAQAAAASEQQLSTMQEISAAAAHLSTLVQELTDKMALFKV
ncbi:methyl-accepting chemotaxis protein [Paenibacillus antibioticophila]|uniref:Methyl-accepting chemotaxis protein n=1 Tax=Paenibacillus antibioticophila TaxID=1274374 RepID=A0A919XWV9_9BACL|nr:methyl-accepting chemotaxis protein [Paenibacillus antibioticophila]GIO37953.1 methyl-accepting chemotaxis protein [Paenibacillus antibioticophila]